MLEVSEIYKSIEGETQYAGLPCVIVRLGGCNLDCSYCDTQYAKNSCTERSVQDIVEEVSSYGIQLVCVTGGEPLIQEETAHLMEKLLDAEFIVLLETNGTVDISTLDPRVTIIMDIKCPSSGMTDQTKSENIDWLGPNDAIKFVIQDREDFEWALHVVHDNALEDKVNVLFSPAHQVLSSDVLVEWILEERLRVRLNLQIHKLIWPGVERGR